MGLTFEHILQVVILILALRALHMVSATTQSCAEVRRHFELQQIGNMRTVPRNPVTGMRIIVQRCSWPSFTFTVNLHAFAGEHRVDVWTCYRISSICDKIFDFFVFSVSILLLERCPVLFCVL